MLTRLRASMTTRLLAGSLIVVVAVTAAVAGYLVYARGAEQRSVALANADERAQLFAELLRNETATTGRAVVDQLVTQPAIGAAMLDADPRGALTRLFASAPSITPAGHALVILDTSGTVDFTTLAAGIPPPSGALPTVRQALARDDAAAGVEDLGDRHVAVDVARRIASEGRVVGVALDVATIIDQLRIVGPAIGPAGDYGTLFIGATDPGSVTRFGSGSARDVSPPDLAAAVQRGDVPAHAAYDAPSAPGSTVAVAGSAVAVADAAGGTAGWVGVEVRRDLFGGDTRGDQGTVLLIALGLLLVTAIAVLVFVDRVVRRPIARLEGGVARIAGGDYAEDIAVTTRDELGRLAASVNRMRGEIAASVAEIQHSRARLDASVDRLAGVSRALTTTASGVDALQEAVVRTAAAGPGMAAVLLLRRGQNLEPKASIGIEGPDQITAWGVVPDLIAGRPVRVDTAPAGWDAGGLLAVPMFYQDEVVGALAVLTAPGVPSDQGDERALAILANSAAVALENTRLFEMERETVRRLRQLDEMKSDFLATVQHELRTPLTAILGMSDLLEMCWTAWDDKQKLDAITDVQIAAHSLHDIVETVIDFSLLERDTLGLVGSPTKVRAAVEEAVANVAARTHGGVPVTLVIEVDDTLRVHADPARLVQVIAALVDNASKFSPAGSTVRITAEQPDTEHVRIDVLDQGCGIPEDQVPRIFDRFFQVDQTATRAHGGTGMGLALVRRLVEAHGASIEVESHVGVGSRFTLLWPATSVAAGGEMITDPRETAGAGA